MGNMLGWQGVGGPDASSRQLQSVLFAVPQVSVVLAQTPAEQQRRFRRHLAFCTGHRETLLLGKLSGRILK